MIFWTRIAIHGLECSDQDDIGDVGVLIDELNMVIGILIAVDQTRVRVSDQDAKCTILDAKCTILDALRRQFDM